MDLATLLDPHVTADDLAARCHDALLRTAVAGGPDAARHLDDLRRLLLRREVRRTPRRRREISAALDAVGRGHQDPDAGTDQRALVNDLRALARALQRCAAIGAGVSSGAEHLAEETPHPAGHRGLVALR